MSDDAKEDFGIDLESSSELFTKILLVFVFVELEIT